MNRVFSFIKNKIPKISATEMIALRSGTASVDRSILQGRISYPKPSDKKDIFPKEELLGVDEA